MRRVWCYALNGGYLQHPWAARSSSGNRSRLLSGTPLYAATEKRDGHRRGCQAFLTAPLADRRDHDPACDPVRTSLLRGICLDESHVGIARWFVGVSPPPEPLDMVLFSLFWRNLPDVGINASPLDCFGRQITGSKIRNMVQQQNGLQCNSSASSNELRNSPPPVFPTLASNRGRSI